MNLFGINLQSVIAAAFRGQVQSGVLIRQINRPAIADRLDAPVQKEVRHPFDGFVGQAKQDTFAGGAGMTSKAVTTIGGTIEVEPKQNDRIEIGGETLTVMAVRNDFTKAVFECYVG